METRGKDVGPPAGPDDNIHIKSGTQLYSDIINTVFLQQKLESSVSLGLSVHHYREVGAGEGDKKNNNNKRKPRTQHSLETRS